MAFRKRRAKRKGLWLPVLGHNLAEEPGSILESSFERVILVGPLKTDLLTLNIPVTFDLPPQTFVVPGLQPPSMADFIGSGYALRRIVGKVTLAHDSRGDVALAPQPAAARVVCYWMVRRVDDAGNFTASNNDIQGTLADNIQDPYIWRNSYFLGAPFDFTRYTAGTAAGIVQDFPPHNQFDGGSQTSPFFDIQTKRNILAEERLFFGISTKAMPMDISFTAESQVYVHVDFRIFAYPIRTMGNRRNASR